MEPQRFVQRRVEIAFLLQPFVCALLAFMLFPLVDLAATGGRTVDALQTAIASGIVTGLVAVLITGVAACAFGYLTKRRALTATDTVLLGAVFGNLPAAVAIVGTLLVQGASALPQAIIGSWRAIVFGTLIGMSSSAVFWWIGGRHVPLGGVSSRSDVRLNR
jgi:hypothetical protein